MKTGREEKVPFEQRALAFEDVENVAHETIISRPRATSSQAGPGEWDAAYW
jgi:hypothetical protein